MVRSQEVRNSTSIARNDTVRPRPLIITPTLSIQWLAYVLTALLALVAIYAIMGNAMSWVGTRVDDLRYGIPRTYQISAVVGHNDGEGTPTQLIAMNLNRQVVVIELPGGDAAKIRTYTGPYLFGAGEDKTPVLMRLEDVNRDGSADLIVNIKNEEIVYLNRDAQFQPISPEERATLIQEK